ncbi:MAG: hypothetical protein EZS28_045039, partial [Streblomastix strix]
YRQNVGEPVDNLLREGSNTTGLPVVYISGSGSDTTGSGNIDSPYQTLRYGIARVDKTKYAEINVQQGVFDVSYIVAHDAKIRIKGEAYHICTLTNSVMPDEGMLWLQSGTIMYLMDFTIIPCQTQNHDAPMIEITEGALIRIRKCYFRSNHIDKMPDVTKDFYNSPIIRVERGRGGLYDCLFYKIYTSGGSPIQIAYGIDDMNFDTIDLEARLNASKTQQAATTYQYKTPNKFEMKNCTFKQ